MEGSILLLLSLAVVLFSHRPLVLGCLTLLTVLYSLHKCDDSLKELATLLLQCLRWADSRFFAARCFVRRHWRRWRFPGRPMNVSIVVPPQAQPERRPSRLTGISPRMGPAQLFSPSSLALTDPRRRRFGLAASQRPTSSNETSEGEQATTKTLQKYITLSWQILLPFGLKSYRCGVSVMASCYRTAAASIAALASHHTAAVHTPRGLRRLPQQPMGSANPLVVALAHCPLLQTVLNRARAHPDCTVNQEAMFAALLPVVNALAAAGAEAEEEEECGRRARKTPVNGLELRLAMFQLDDRERSLADLTEWLVMQLHITCKDMDSRPRLVADLKKVEVNLFANRDFSQEELIRCQMQLSRLAPVSTLDVALRPSSPHAAALRKLSTAALASEELRSGSSELRHLLGLQTADLSICAACGRPAVSFSAPLLLRLSAQAPSAGVTSLSDLVRRALAVSPQLCNSVTCKACGASGGSPRPADLFSHGLLSPICMTPTRGPSFLPATPTASAVATQTSTPVGGWRCRGDGCCRRLLRRLPACLLLSLPPGAKVTPPLALDIDAEMLLAPDEAGSHYTVRSITGDGGVAFCRLGNRQEWFEFADEKVRRLGPASEGGLERMWHQRGMNSQERVLLLERTT